MLKELQNELTYEQYNEMQVFDVSQISKEFTEDVESGMPSEQVNIKYFNGKGNINVLQTKSADLTVLDTDYTLPYNYVHVIFSKDLEVDSRIYNSSFTFITEEHTEGLIKGYILIKSEIKNLVTHSLKLSFEVLGDKVELRVLKDSNKEFTKYVMQGYIQWLCLIFGVFKKLSTINQQVYKSYIVHNNDKDKFKHLKSTKQNKYVRTNLNKDTHIILPTDFNITKFIHERDNSSIRKQYTYTHAFIVRGHFRTLNNPDTLGMNMLGERVIKGKTWVNSFMKNSKMQLVNKTKVVSYK